jgi:hypothetical protein
MTLPILAEYSLKNMISSQQLINTSISTERRGHLLCCIGMMMKIGTDEEEYSMVGGPTPP